MILTIVLAGLLLMAVCFGILMCHALTISLEERDKWYTPVDPPKPVKWDYVDGEWTKEEK